MLKTLVITSCTGEKRFHPENQLIQDDFVDRDKLSAREKELAEYTTAAGDMYTGMQHLRLMEGISMLRDKFGHDVVNLYVVSAGYGLIHEDKQIVPYEVTFNTMSGAGIKAWAEQLRIHTDLETVIPQYDLVLFLLGDKYLKAVSLPLMTARKEQRILVFASGTSRKMIPDTEPYHFVEVGQEDAKSFSYGLVGLKGYLFKLLAQDMVGGESDLMEHLYADPAYVVNALDRHRKPVDTTPKPEQLSMFPEEDKPAKEQRAKSKKEKKPVSVEFYIPDAEVAANFTGHMKYFIPEWDDREEPGYDFIHDQGRENRDPYLDDIYAHEIYATPNYDGILISKVIVEENKKKKALIEQMGVHSFLRFDQSRPIMGDCGAFDYIDEYEPPFQTDEILDYYQNLGFSIGVSIDHLIVGPYAADPAERMRRYNLTKRNAEEFLRKHKEGHYTFLPSGIAQGWDPKSYRDAVADLIAMGYTHICLGGLVRTNTPGIIEILKEIKPLIPDYLTLHLFGVARPDALEPFCRYGANAMDSATHLRRAWLGTSGNYFGVNGKHYAAIRIPPVDGHGVRVKKMVESGSGTYEQFRVAEEKALTAIRQYDKGQISVDDALAPIVAYDEMLGDDRDVHRRMYRETLEDRPWQLCGCEICRSLGVEVVIFRGNNRNRRRGFHNTYVFYKLLKELYPDD